MSANTFGKIFQLTSFGESHGPAIGGVITGTTSSVSISKIVKRANLSVKPYFSNCKYIQSKISTRSRGTLSFSSEYVYNFYNPHPIFSWQLEMCELSAMNWKNLTKAHFSPTFAPKCTGTEDLLTTLTTKSESIKQELNWEYSVVYTIRL